MKAINANIDLKLCLEGREKGSAKVLSYAINGNNFLDVVGTFHSIGNFAHCVKTSGSIPIDVRCESINGMARLTVEPHFHGVSLYHLLTYSF